MILIYVADRLTWFFGDGSHIPLGFGCLLGYSAHLRPSPRLLHVFSQRGLFFISSTISHWSLQAPIFKSAVQLGLEGDVGTEWNRFLNYMREVGLCDNRGGDRIT